MPQTPALRCSCYAHIDFRDTNMLSVFVVVLPSVVNSALKMEIPTDFYVVCWRIYKNWHV